MTTTLLTQDNVYLSITTPLAKDALILSKFQGTEGLMELFHFEAEVYAPHLNTTDNKDLDFTALIQENVTIQIAENGNVRFISGIVTHISQGPTVSFNATLENKVYEKTYYYLTIQPKAWLMTLTENCTIFQNQAPLDIIKSILEFHQIDILDRTSKAGRTKRDYYVQYNESDFNFISRLMEAEGIYYYFAHDKGKHTLILCDNSQPFEKNPVYTQVPVVYYTDHPPQNVPGLTNLRISRQIVPSGYITKDYDFEKPSTNLKADSPGKGDKRTLYHYPGDYILQPEGQSIADRRLGSAEFPFASFQGDTNIPLLEIGTTFTLTDCPRKDANNKEYVTYRLYHEGKQKEDSESIESSSSFPYYNKVTLFEKSQTYLPPLKTPSPKIYGTQTAIVMGKEGEEIWTDKYGRILVKFHWDLSDTMGDKTSCWIRVAQQWTGKNWGMVFIPRVGQEVVVSFLNGNPDYPLVTGCVYNGENLPPYLPGEPTKSTIKTNTSKGGEGFNELRFEDKADAEEIYMHAQKDLNTIVLNGHRTTTLEGQKEGGNDTLLLKKGNRAMTLNEGDETVTLKKGNRTQTLEDGNETVTLKKGDRTQTLEQGNETITLKQGNRTIDVKGDQNVKVNGNYTLEVGGNLTIKAKGGISIESSASYDLKVQAAAQVQALSYKLTAETTLEAQAQAQMSLKAPMIEQQGDAMLSIKGAMVQISGDGVVTVKGGMIMLG